MVSECEIQRQKKDIHFHMNQICGLSSPSGIKELKRPRVPLAPLEKTPEPTVPMPCQANLSGKLKKAEVKTSSVVINKFPGARLRCHLKNGWPWACYLPSLVTVSLSAKWG